MAARHGFLDRCAGPRRSRAHPAGGERRWIRCHCPDASSHIYRIQHRPPCAARRTYSTVAAQPQHAPTTALSVACSLSIHDMHPCTLHGTRTRHVRENKARSRVRHRFHPRRRPLPSPLPTSAPTFPSRARKRPGRATILLAPTVVPCRLPRLKGFCGCGRCAAASSLGPTECHRITDGSRSERASWQRSRP